MARARATTVTTTSSDQPAPTLDDITPSPAEAGGGISDTPVKVRRKRGPNKPKVAAVPDAHISVRTEVSIAKTEIVKLLTNHVRAMLGEDAAKDLELQISVIHPAAGDEFGMGGVAGGGWAELSGAVRFATKGSK